MTSADERAELEAKIRRLFDAGDKRKAATLLLEGYGREIFGFLVSRLRDRQAAGDVFSKFTEDVWRGLDGFRWQCTVRVWAYTLARHAASQHVRDARRRRAREQPLSRAGPFSEIADRLRTDTFASVRTEAKSQIAQLRERLPADEQTLLILRINRKLSWTEIAQVMFHEGEVVESATLERESVRLRKRFEATKKKLQRMAVEAGLVPSRGES